MQIDIGKSQIRRELNRRRRNKIVKAYLVGILQGMLILAGTVGLINLILNTIDRNAQNECLKWQSQAKELRNFYLTQAEAKQCEAVGVEVNAPVRGQKYMTLSECKALNISESRCAKGIRIIE